MTNYDRPEAFTPTAQYTPDQLLDALLDLHANWPANTWRAEKSAELFAELDRRMRRGNAPTDWRSAQGWQIGDGNTQTNHF